MTKKEFQELAASDIVLLDGATGSNFRKAGMPVGVSTELWAMEHPDVVRTLQSGYVEAGSQIIYAPTFSANRLGLEMHGLTDRLEEINTKLGKLSKEKFLELKQGVENEIVLLKQTKSEREKELAVVQEELQQKKQIAGNTEVLLTVDNLLQYVKKIEVDRRKITYTEFVF